MSPEHTGSPIWAGWSGPDGRGLALLWGLKLLAWGCGVLVALALAGLLWDADGWEALTWPEAPASPPVVPASLAVATAPEATVALTGPHVHERDAAWLWLQQRLQAQGLRVVSLRPEAWQNGPVMAQQNGHLRLQGAWADWLAFTRALASHAPWWSWTRWQLQAAERPEAVQIDAELRLWLRPDGEAASAGHEQPRWPVAKLYEAAAPLFAQANAAGPATPASAPRDPADGAPGWRVWGVWTQAGERRVVLGRGPDWVALALGQGAGPQGPRLDHIGPEGVRLSMPGGAPRLFLPWEGTP